VHDACLLLSSVRTLEIMPPHIVCTSTRWQSDLRLGIISVPTYLWDVRTEHALFTFRRILYNSFCLRQIIKIYVIMWWTLVRSIAKIRLKMNKSERKVRVQQCNLTGQGPPSKHKNFTIYNLADPTINKTAQKLKFFD